MLILELHATVRRIKRSAKQVIDFALHLGDRRGKLDIAEAKQVTDRRRLRCLFCLFMLIALSVDVI